MESSLDHTLPGDTTQVTLVSPSRKRTHDTMNHSPANASDANATSSNGTKISQNGHTNGTAKSSASVKNAGTSSGIQHMVSLE